MIDALPPSLVPISAFHTMSPSGILCHITNVMLTDTLQGRAIGTVVEVACYHDMCLRRDVTEGVQ